MQHDITSTKWARESGNGARLLMAGRIENESVIEYPMTMRSVLLRCLVVLVALALVGGTTVNARTHAMPSGVEGPLWHDTADAGTSINKSPQHHNTHACRCCCLGCASFANRADDGTSGVVPVSEIVIYGERISALAGRILCPDPYPPRLSI
jgi:hypothetical protein